MNEIKLSQLNPSLFEKLRTLAAENNCSLEEEIETLLESQVREAEMTQSSIVETSHQRENESHLTQSAVNDEGGFGCARDLIIIPSDFDEPLEELGDYT